MTTFKDAEVLDSRSHVVAETVVFVHLCGEEVVLMTVEVVGPSIIGHIVNGQHQAQEKYVSNQLTQQEVQSRQLQALLPCL